MKKVEKKEQNKQMELGLRSPLRNILFKAKGKVEKLLLHFEAARYFRDAINWLYIVISLSLIFMQIYFSIRSYNQLPTEVPLFSYFNQFSKKLVIKEYIWILPAISLIMTALAGRFSYRYFHKERLLSRMLLLILLLSTALITILSLRISLPYYG